MLAPAKSPDLPAHDLLRQFHAERDEITQLADRAAGLGWSGGGGGGGGGGGVSKLASRTTLPADTLVVQIAQLGGASAAYRVWPRDISVTGIGFIHGAYVHTGGRCTVSLPAIDGRTVNIAGQVARCEYVRGRAHFVGVRFDQAIALHEFIPGLAPPETDAGRSRSGAAGAASASRDLKTLVAELQALSGSREIPVAMRKVIRAIAEQVGNK